MGQRLELLQEQFRNFDFKHAHVVEHLHSQANQLLELHFFVARGDANELSSQVADLDCDLLRCACAHMAASIGEAAKHDCARLVVESLFDMTGTSAVKYWEAWLSHAPCWPLLAEGNWSYVLARASDLAQRRLETDGVAITDVARDQINGALTRLRLEDLLPAEVFAKAFPGLFAKDESEA